MTYNCLNLSYNF